MTSPVVNDILACIRENNKDDLPTLQLAHACIDDFRKTPDCRCKYTEIDATMSNKSGTVSCIPSGIWSLVLLRGSELRKTRHLDLVSIKGTR